MALSDAEFETLLHDSSKRIDGDINAARLVRMSETDLCRDFGGGLAALFQCSPHGEYQRIRTPYLYPDGDNIDLFCKPQGDVTLVTDLGETTRWLRTQTISPRRSAKQRALLDDACLTHGVEFYRGMIHARCRNPEHLSAVVLRVAQAALRVSDLWFTFRTRSVESMGDEVADLLTERELSFERGEKLSGRSGRGWTVDFHVRAPHRSSLVFAMSTGSRSAAKSVAEHVLAAWVDLHQYAAGPEAMNFVSLFDDTLDVWSDSDFKLLEPTSMIARWSEPEAFLKLLAEGA